MPVDQVLNDFYGTIQEQEPTQEELQKTASLEMLVKIAEEEGIDLDQVSDEDIMEAYNELAGEDAESDGDAEEGDLEKEAQEKIAEADTMGRIMAHSFVNELREINGDLEKTARGQWPPSEEDISAGAVKGGGKKGKSSEQWPPSPEGGKASRVKAKAKTVGEGVKELGRKARFQGSYAKDVLKSRLKGLSTTKKGLIGAAVAAPVLAGGAVGAKKLSDAVKARKEKTSYDQAVEHRALQYLSDAGLMYEDGSVVPPEALQKQAEDVDQAALQLLAEMGYPVEQE